MEKKLEKIINWGVAGLVFSLPLFFLPLTTEFYNWNKNFLLFLGVLGLLGLWAGKMVVQKQVRLVHTPLDLPILVFGLVVLASTILTSANKVESFLTPGGTGTILALTLLYFLVTQISQIGQISGACFLASSKISQIGLTASAVILAVGAIFSFLGVGESLGLPPWLAVRTWTPAGGLLPLATFLGVIFLSNLSNLGNLRKQPGGLLKTAGLILIFGGLGVTVYQLVVSQPIFLPYRVGWAVAVESFKNYPLWGVGLGQFLTAFTRFKPLGFNMSNLWAFRFTSSSNYYFNLLTEVGAVGLGAWGFLVYRVYREYRGKADSLPSCFAVLLVFLLLAFLPANFLLLFLLYFLLANWAVSLPNAQRLKIGLVALREGLVAVERTDLPASRQDLEKYYREEQEGQEGLKGKEGKIEILPWLVFVPIVILVLGSFYFLGQVYAAEMDYKSSLDAAVANRGKETYDLQIAAITKNPYFDYYRVSYSQVNFALANNIASREDLTDQDRATITQLIQQSIGEAKAAVALNRVKVQNWENLASLYRALINFASDADQWAVAAYFQAVNLDPINPALRIDLGGVFYALRDYEQAQRQFEIAVNLKPDLANAHYNLAAALKEQAKPERAQQELETTLNLVEVGSADYERVKSELQALKEGLEKAAGEQALETLTPPQPAQEGIQPPLELPEETGPEITVTPMVTITPTPTPFPSPTLIP